MVSVEQDYFVAPTSGHRVARYVWEAPSKVRCVVVVVHGYGHHVRGMIHDDFAKRFYDAGIAVEGVDHFAHGNSDGLFGYVENFGDLVQDLADFVKESVKPKYPGIPVFLMGQSMGGAVSILAVIKGGPLYSEVDGMVLLAPMCKISDGMRPPQWQIDTLEWITRIIPTWPITPIPSVAYKCFKDPQKLKEALADPLSYTHRAEAKYWIAKPRLMTAVQCRNATEQVDKSLELIETAFLICHGDDDVVTDPAASKECYDRASSTDKKLNMYPGMWHAMLSEPDGGREKVMDDVVAWVTERS